jgi:hypothetical protein
MRELAYAGDMHDPQVNGNTAASAIDPTWAKLVRTLAVEFGQDGAFVVG